MPIQKCAIVSLFRRRIDNFTPADRLIALAALTVISKPDPGKLLDIEVIAIQKIKDDFCKLPHTNKQTNKQTNIARGTTDPGIDSVT